MILTSNGGSTVASSALDHPPTPKHQQGICAMYGQCGPKVDSFFSPPLNCPANIPAVKVRFLFHPSRNSYPLSPLPSNCLSCLSWYSHLSLIGNCMMRYVGRWFLWALKSLLGGFVVIQPSLRPWPRMSRWPQPCLVLAPLAIVPS